MRNKTGFGRGKENENVVAKNKIPYMHINQSKQTK